MAGTAWFNFTYGTKIRASEINANFDWMEGHIVPQLNGVKNNGSYDLGSSTYKWNNAYFQTGVNIGGQAFYGVNTATILFYDDAGVELRLAGGSNSDESSGILGTTANDGGTQKHILQGSVSTPDLRTGAVALLMHAETGIETSMPSTLYSHTITTEGGKILVMASLWVIYTPSVTAGTPKSINYGGVASVYRSTTAVTGCASFIDIKTETNMSALDQTPKMIHSMFSVDEQTAGTYSYNLCFRQTRGSGYSVIGYSLDLVELKKM